MKFIFTQERNLYGRLMMKLFHKSTFKTSHNVVHMFIQQAVEKVIKRIIFLLTPPPPAYIHIRLILFYSHELCMCISEKQ